MLQVRLYRFKEGGPGFLELDQDLIADFARQGLVSLGRLDQVIDIGVVEVEVLEDEGLAYIVVGQVPEVLGGPCHFIDGSEARVSLADEMLLHQLHASFSCLPQPCNCLTIASILPVRLLTRACARS
jgi:hypothetical protein